MTEAAQITVRGEGSIEITPDRANVHSRVLVRGKIRGRTVQRARAKLAQLAKTLDMFQIGYEQRRTEQITAIELFDPKTGRSVGYEASSLTTVRLSDFADLGRLIDAIAGKGSVDVTGPQWEVSSGHDGHLEACGRASAAARRRAQAFADGVGMSLGRLVTMQEEVAWRQQEAQMTAVPAQAGGAQAASGIWSGVVRLTSAVTATFEVHTAIAANVNRRGEGATPIRDSQPALQP